MTQTIPAGRMPLSELAPKQYAAMFRLANSVEFDHSLRTLVEVRVSQINRCAFCLDMHWKDARAAGESEARLYSLDAWRESPLYTERERAALALCEAITLINEERVSDEVWERAVTAFEQPDLAQLVFVITTINAWNRLAITARLEPGHYRTGQLRVPAQGAA